MDERSVHGLGPQQRTLPVRLRRRDAHQFLERHELLRGCGVLHRSSSPAAGGAVTITHCHADSNSNSDGNSYGNSDPVTDSNSDPVTESITQPDPDWTRLRLAQDLLKQQRQRTTLGDQPWAMNMLGWAPGSVSSFQMLLSPSVVSSGKP